MQLAFFLTFMTLLVGIALSILWDHAGLPTWTSVRMKRNRRATLVRVPGGRAAARGQIVAG